MFKTRPNFTGGRKVQGDQTVYVALNLAEYEYEIRFNTHLPALVDVISGKMIQVDNGNAYIKMPPFSSMVIVSDDIVNVEPESVPVQTTEEDKDTEIVIGARYRHFKGGEYEVITTARHSETNEELVIYKNTSNNEVWARPREMFVGKAGDVRRFVKL